ncbi:hypothetical protein JXO59_16530, partial [candidate division KSB1 bacterium]|nr:hypothetical protein [candidate division KSB1 bacterium]
MFKVWNWENNRTIYSKTLETDEEWRPIEAIHFSKDNSSLLMIHDQSLKKLDLASGNLSIISDYYPNKTLSVSPDGSTIVYGTALYNAATGDKTIDFRTKLYGSFSLDGRLLVGNGEDDLVLLDTRTGDKMHHSSIHPDDVESIDFSPNGQLILVCGHDKSITIWDVNTTRKIAQFFHLSGCLHHHHTRRVFYGAGRVYQASAFRARHRNLRYRSVFLRLLPARDGGYGPQRQRFARDQDHGRHPGQPAGAPC